MEKAGSAIRSNLTKLIVGLMKATPERRAAADPVKVAEEMGLPLQWVEYWINHYRKVWDDAEKAKKNPRQQRQRARR